MSLTISAAQVDAFIANPTSFSGYSSGGPVIISGSITVAQANSLNSINATYIKATIDSASATSLAGIATNNSSRTAANQFTVAVNDTSASAATLKSVAAMSSSANFSTIDSITASSAADIKAVYADTSTTFATDVLIAVNDSTIAAADLKAINDLTSDKVTSTATTISGTVADLGTVLAVASTKIGRAADIAVTITDTVADAGDLVALDDDGDITNGRTTGRFTTGRFTLSSGTSLIGTRAEALFILGAKYALADGTTPARFTNIKDANITLDSGTRGTVTPLTAAQIGDVIEVTNGKVTAETSDTALSTIVAAGSIAGTGHTITVPTILDNSVTAANLKTLDAATTKPLTFNPADNAIDAPAISGNASDLKDVFNSSTYSTVLNSAVLTVAGNTTVADVNILNSKTTGAITATIAATTMNELAAITDKTGSSENIYTIAVGDLELDAAALVALVDKVDATQANKITVSNANTVTGTFENINKILTVAAYTTPLTGYADKKFVITDTNLNLDATKFLAIDTANDGGTTFVTPTGITGSHTQIDALYTNTNNRFNGTTGFAGTEAVTILGETGTTDTVDAAHVTLITGRHRTNTSNDTAVAGLTTGGLTLDSTVTKIKGSEAEILIAIESNSPTPQTDPADTAAPRLFGLETRGLVVDAYSAGSALTSTNIAKLQNATTGVIEAALGTFGDGALDKYINLTTGALAFEAGNKYSFKITENAIDATKLLKLNTVMAATTGTVTFDPANTNSSPTFNGTAAELAKFFTSANNGGGTIAVEGAGATIGDHLITITDASIAASDLKSIITANAGHKTTNGVTATAVTDITGSAADIKSIYTAQDVVHNSNHRVVNDLNNKNITITDFELAADVLDDITIATTTANGTARKNGTGNVNVTSSKISGLTADVTANMTLFSTAGNGFTANSDIDIELSDADVAAKITALNDMTTGTITATLSTAGKLSTFAALTGADERVHAITVSANDTQVDAGALKTLNAKTTGVIQLTAVSSLTGSAADVLAAFNAGATEVTGLNGDEAVTLTSFASVADITALEAKTSAVIASGVADTVANLLTLTETANNLTFSITDDTVKATDLALVKAKTTGTVNLKTGAVIEGTDTEIKALVTGTGLARINNFANVTSSLTGGAYSVDDINLVETALDNASTANAKSIKATVIETDFTELNTLQRNGAYTITLERTSPESAAGAGDSVEKLTAGNVNTINGKTTEVLVVNTSAFLDGSTNDIKTALEANKQGTISGLGAVNVSVDTTGIAISDANYIDERTTGVVTASLATLEIESFIAPTTDVIAFGSGNNYSFVIDDDTQLTAAEAKQLILLNNATSGTITITPDDTSAADIKGELADLVQIAQSAKTATQITAGDTNGFADLADAQYTITDTGVVSLADLNIIEATTSGNVVATTATGFIGSITDADAAYDTSSTITNAGTQKVTITGTITVAQATAAAAYTSGVLTAAVSDTAANLKALANEGANKITVSMTGTTAAAADVILVNADTAGLITSTVGTITGSAADLKTVFAANDGTQLTGFETAAVTISSPGASVADANIISAATTGVVSGAVSTTDMATLKTLGETGNAYTVTVADTTITAADLKTLDSKTTGTVTVNAATNISGALSDLKAIYEANTAGQITGLGNEVISITDTGEVQAADLHTVNTLNSGVFSANSVTSVKGSVVDLLKVYSSGNTAGVIAGLGNENLIITDTGTVAASDINTLDGLTTGTITASSVTKLTGSVTEITAARSGATVTGVTSLALTGSTETFNATSYLASNGDLIKAFGNSPASAVTHYLAFGVNESRNLDSFDEKSYLASHGDLLTAFGSDTAKATAHYISHGYTENRALDTFDEFGYIASYSDLITALGADATAAVDHYINFGYGEKRSSTFDASSYLSVNADLQAAFGSDLEAAKKHYINHGSSENRLLA